MGRSTLEIEVELDACQAQLAGLDAPAQLQWGLQKFPSGFALTTSFGIQSAVLLHLAHQLQPDIPVFWVDTGYLPPETYDYAETLKDLLQLNLEVVQPAMSAARMEALMGKLWESEEPGALATYHRLRKVEPLDQALLAKQVSCWASGVRARQTDHRATMAPLELVRGCWSLRPLLLWTSRDVYYYMQQHSLPAHPLFEKGYSSVGDWHSSGPDGGQGRGSRFAGKQQECGLHLQESMLEGAGI
ncbi:MAG: Phosphoadenosine phosphosulfate reductase reductase [Cyanobacteriota bacterium]|jgi:phosphoadenosine phosphosulfate reductase